jgi:hypothetical protein
MTERYAHLRPGLFTEHDLPPLSLDLTPGEVPATNFGDWMGKEPSNRAAIMCRNAGAAL